MKEMKNHETILLVIVLGMVIFMDVVWGIYNYNNVPIDYDAERILCQKTISFYEDVQEDMINYERANTDMMGLADRGKLLRCYKIVNYPQRYLLGEYLNFWAMWVCVILLEVILLASYWVIFYMSKEPRSGSRGRRDGSGQGRGRAGGSGIGSKKGGRRGKC